MWLEASSELGEGFKILYKWFNEKKIFRQKGIFNGNQEILPTQISGQ